MAILRDPRILFFIQGSVPTAEQIDEATKLGRNVAFRNVNFIRPDDFIEDFDDVAGVVPSQYAEAAAVKAGLPSPRETPKADAGALPPAGSPVAPVAPAGGSGGGWKPNT